ncbi:ubiquinol-cytochrome c reductase iron-sulfur subunit [Okeania sp.]|uniref:QcrA and Rieske domain-containing protein n=1 Tax=Okeania sp. TaxID=3100323 RepID=UPI002B4ADE4C|nr:ubiquinol-cytochrome c reductase iron-sulfur subunit [Okeania sp.]MEB3342083.1 ubiquinol-cytochrome c reductase iron-sulfur subunit [Okeania sp.]
MERRTFLNWVGVGMLSSFIPVAIAACQSTQTNNSPANKTATKIDTSIREDGFQALGTVEQLETEGEIIDRRNAAKPVIIFRNPDTNDLVAINPMCTHQGCTVKLDLEGKQLACPCHGSKFAFDGKVMNPPATENLDIFAVKQEDNLLLVKVN